MYNICYNDPFFVGGGTYKLILAPFYIEMAVPIFMIISGMTLSMSFEKRRITDFTLAYSPALLIQRIAAYSIPWIAICFVELAACIVSKKYSIVQWLFQMICGGYGPGSYYFPLLIQLTLIFPIIYFTIKRHDFLGVVVFFASNVIYEAAATFYHIGPEFYRLCILRYIFCISVGCYTFFGRSKARKSVVLLSIAIGFAYICLVNYFDYRPIIFTNWTSTSCIASLYVAPIIFLILRKKESTIKLNFLQKIGQCSYEIFLVQMAYFWVIPHQLIKLGISSAAIFVINLAVCISVGMIFYYVERPVTKKIIWLLEKIDFNQVITYINKMTEVQDV